VEENDARLDSHIISLGYGRGEVRLNLSHRPDVKVLLPPKSPSTEPAVRLLARSLASPVGSAPLSEMAAGKKSVTIVVPDKTRPPVARDVLPFLLQELEAAGVRSSDINIFIACGIHARHTDDDIRPLVGDEVFETHRIFQNDGRSAGDFVSLGTTSRGTPVEVNRVVADSDLVLPVGGLAFHYFAGFTGGRMIIPGAASVNTVENNHRLTLTEAGEMNPGCASGALAGNPVHEDMLECVGHIPGDIYLVSVISDGWGNVAGVVSGDIVESHEAGTRLVRQLFECRLEGPCDVAVAGAGGHPLDVNLIQSHKSLEHAAASVRDGGVLIGVLACEEGIGSETFLPWFKYPDSREVTRNLYANYELNGHTALSFMQKRERVRVILVTDLARETVEELGVYHAGNLDEALSMADAVCGKGARMCVFPLAWGLLPVVSR
jgi:nickel-dependent lactate racemase